MTSALAAGYAGCFEHKWGYADSPHHASYYKGDGTKFAVGPFYAVDGSLATAVSRANLPLRFFTNEGGLLGASCSQLLLQSIQGCMPAGIRELHHARVASGF